MSLPTGIITLWVGAIVDIPEGWALCDGNNGTPDLRNRFIVGAGDTYDPGDNGGNNNHDHNFTTDGHSHTLGAGVDLATGPAFDSTTTPNNDTGTTDSESNLPPYYALAFIMKL